MKKRWYMIFGALLSIGVIIGIVWMVNRGVPAINTSAYSYSAEPEAGSELQSVPAGDQIQLAGMKVVAQNDQLALHYNEETSEIAVSDRASRQTWYSNPIDRLEDSMASQYEQSMLSSQLVLQYRDLEGNLYTYTNHEKSIANEQFQAEAIADGLRVIYTMGDVSK